MFSCVLFVEGRRMSTISRVVLITFSCIYYKKYSYISSATSCYHQHTSLIGYNDIKELITVFIERHVSHQQFTGLSICSASNIKYILKCIFFRNLLCLGALCNFHGETLLAKVFVNLSMSCSWLLNSYRAATKDYFDKKLII